MSWKQERDGLIAQTLAFVQSVTGKRDEPARPEAIAPLPSDEGAAVGAAALMAVEAALGAAASSVVPSVVAGAARGVPPKVAPRSLEPPGIASSPGAPRPTVQRPIVQSEMANEIRARVASFRAHQERFNREREEYFATTLARLRAAIKDPPPRFGK